MGDFNDINFNHEKEEGHPKQGRMMDTFNSMITDSGLIDAGFKELSFTWSNNREGIERVR